MSIYNKIVFNGQTLIDLSNDTVDSSDDIVEGLVGHLNNGTSVTGTASGGSGGGSSSDAVRFIDYDGTVLYSYSASEFANLTAMPTNPTHTGLTSQGWNYTLADAKAQVTATGTCDIGQMYVTDDGKTRIYISLVDSARLSPYLGICPNGTVVVDWGDNTATDTLTGASLTTVITAQHTYASTGDYVITLTISIGTFAIYGASGPGSYLLTRNGTSLSSQRCYQNAIQKVELGASVSLSTYAFDYCFSLTSITIPSGVTGIGANAFAHCYSLASITIPSGVTSIGNGTFLSCYSLASITIPSGVTSIGSQAFTSCYPLARITIPSSVTSIGATAFSACYSLASITIPSGVTAISSTTFNECYSLTSITIPSGVTGIGANAFQYCRSLASITIPSSVTSIGSYAFAYCYSLASITLPSGTTSIGTYAFAYCSSLTSITIPSGTTSIGTYAFNECRSLASITIPSGVTSIGANTFQYCNSLASITIPSGVTSIGTYAFAYCTCIAEYHFLPTAPPTLANTSAFSSILADCKIYVPAASLTAYQEATNWSTYASYMIGE